MTVRRIWQNETDKVSAESLEQVAAFYVESYGWGKIELDAYPFDPEPVSDDKVIRVTFRDGAEDGRAYPTWVDDEPEANLTWSDNANWACVEAPARIWAKHESGMICSTEY